MFRHPAVYFLNPISGPLTGRQDNGTGYLCKLPVRCPVIFLGLGIIAGDRQLPGKEKSIETGVKMPSVPAV